MKTDFSLFEVIVGNFIVEFLVELFCGVPCGVGLGNRTRMKTDFILYAVYFDCMIFARRFKWILKELLTVLFCFMR